MPLFFSKRESHIICINPTRTAFIQILLNKDFSRACITKLKATTKHQQT
jgi:hypothetical protein